MAEILDGDGAKPRWRARWYLWDGGALTMGRGTGVVPQHSHHAIQVVVGLDGEVGLRGAEEEEWVMERGLAVLADVPHQFTPAGTLLAMIFVDPESREGNWLQRSLRTPSAGIPEGKLEQVLPMLQAVWEDPPGAEETARQIHTVVRGLCVGPPPVYAPDPRILRALEVIRQMDTSKISLDEVARAVFLSPSRFAHLFSAEVGIPFRRYVLWRRLTRAMLAVGAGNTLSAAAHLCGFSDSAHLTRACVQMFGMPPSVMMAPGEFYEIPAPFELPPSAA